MNRPEPFDIDGFFQSRPDLRPKQFKPPKQFNQPEPSNPNRSHTAYSQAREWLSKEPPAISGQGGSNRTFTVILTLLKAFALSTTDALSLLKEWNQSCTPPWSDLDLLKKVNDAENIPDRRERGWKLDKSSFDGFSPKFDKHGDDNNNHVSDHRNRDSIPVHSSLIDDPYSLAAQFVQGNIIEDNLCKYRWMEGQFYRYNGSYYDELTKEKINADICEFIESKYLERYNLDCAEVTSEGKQKVNNRKVSNSVIETIKTCLINMIIINNEDQSEPFWLIPNLDWKAEDVIPAANRLIHLPSFVNGNEKAYTDKTPKLFSTYSLKYNFNFISYKCPVEAPPVWKKFLNSIFPGDQEAIDTLQEFFGYFLTPSTRLQKILMLIGQKRSGKGTIIRTLTHMLGEINVCSPTFKSLTTQFGRQALMGKSVAVFPDARITGRTDTGDVVECLLSISGEDAQTIDRKFMPHVSKKLSCRFLISSNELPRLTENSGALVTRAIVLKFDQTFIGNEDIELEIKLMPEIPHILRWSIDGWARLAERNQFSQPSSGQQAVDDFAHLSSPVSQFIHDNIDFSGEHETDTKELYNSFRVWCGYQGNDRPGDMSNFIRSIKSTRPELVFSKENISHNGDGVMWARRITGARIKPVLVNGNGVYEGGNRVGSDWPDPVY